MRLFIPVWMHFEFTKNFSMIIYYKVKIVNMDKKYKWNFLFFVKNSQIYWKIFICYFKITRESTKKKWN